MLKIAIRNIVRNKRRTLVTFLLIAMGSFLVAIFRFMAYGSHQDMIWHVVGLQTGYIEIAANGWVENPSIERALDVDDALLESLKSKNIHTISPRIAGYGLVNHNAESKFSTIYAADFDKEKKITNLHEKIIKGAYPHSTQANAAIIGQKMALQLDLDVGSRFNIISTQFDGSVGVVQPVITGIYKAVSTQLDTSHIMISLAKGQELFALDPSPLEKEHAGKSFARYTSIGLGIDNYLLAEQEYERLHALYPLPPLKPDEDRGLSPNYDPVAYNWDVLNPGIVQLVLLDQVSGEMMVAFLLMILAAGVFNNVQMSIQERQREFGVLLSIGMRPVQIGVQVLLELNLVLLPSMAIGMLAGIGLGNYLDANPITFTGANAEMYVEMGFQPTFRAIVDTTELWIAILSLLVPALVFALLAVRRIFKLKPAEIVNTI